MHSVGMLAVALFGAVVSAQRVCDDKRGCNPANKFSCNSRSEVCMDDPWDNCDPASSKDCKGCCVFDACLKHQCPTGQVCQLDLNAEPFCTPDVCNAKRGCDPSDKYSCESRSHVCLDNPYDTCDPATSAKCSACCVFDDCQRHQCPAGTECKLNTAGKAFCSPSVCAGARGCDASNKGSCNSRSEVCLDFPGDDCSPTGEDGPKCRGCCVFDACVTFPCTHPRQRCELDAQGKPYCTWSRR